ncbi:DUF86 domain-containing protein [Candidatus Roizmanbacteria bacterium]|nr:DUF86 domain-containing protein [Candidatus Roizmanbacteria bacterium]
MKKNNQVYLQDISKAVFKIEKYTKDVDFEIFLKDEMRQDAVIRQFEIIGEAANRISKDFLKDHPKFPLKEAIRMRNFLIHGYDEVNVEVVWKTVQVDIPLLKKNL